MRQPARPAHVDSTHMQRQQQQQQRPPLLQPVYTHVLQQLQPRGWRRLGLAEERLCQSCRTVQGFTDYVLITSQSSCSCCRRLRLKCSSFATSLLRRLTVSISAFFSATSLCCSDKLCRACAGRAGAEHVGPPETLLVSRCHTHSLLHCRVEHREHAFRPQHVPAAAGPPALPLHQPSAVPGP